MMEKKEYTTRIAKNGNSPLLALDYYTTYPDTPLDLTGYTGTLICWTEFLLEDDVTVGDTDIFVRPIDNTTLLSHLIAAGDVIIIGSRTAERLVCSGVTDSAISIQLTDTLNAYKANETVKIIWLEASISASNIVVGADGATKNRVQYQLADTDTTRVYPRHKYAYKLTDATLSVELMLPDSRYICWLDIFDDINSLGL